MVLAVKNLSANAGNKRHGFDPWVGKIPWRRAWQPTPVFLPGEYHGQRKLASYSPWDPEELDMMEATQHTSMHSQLINSDSFSWTVKRLSCAYTRMHYPPNFPPVQAAHM